MGTFCPPLGETILSFVPFYLIPVGKALPFRVEERSLRFPLVTENDQPFQS